MTTYGMQLDARASAKIRRARFAAEMGAFVVVVAMAIGAFAAAVALGKAMEVIR